MSFHNLKEKIKSLCHDSIYSRLNGIIKKVEESIEKKAEPFIYDGVIERNGLMNPHTGFYWIMQLGMENNLREEDVCLYIRELQEIVTSTYKKMKEALWNKCRGELLLSFESEKKEMEKIRRRIDGLRGTLDKIIFNSVNPRSYRKVGKKEKKFLRLVRKSERAERAIRNYIVSNQVLLSFVTSKPQAPFDNYVWLKETNEILLLKEMKEIVEITYMVEIPCTGAKKVKKKIVF